jgi:hypothetical protein
MNPLNRGDTMNYTSLIRHQVAIRVGTVSGVLIKIYEGLPEAVIKTEQGRVFVVIGGKDRYIKAQVDVIAQLNQIMNNVSIKRA